MAARQLSDGNDEGTVLGQGATDKVAFHGSTPIAQRSSSLSAITTTAPVSGTGYGLSHAAMTALIAGYNEIQATLVAYGLHG